jgi:hypothetical protein
MALTKVTYSMIDGAVVNVRDFGATGNGTTDDTAAIQAALNYLATLGDGGGVTPFRRSGGTLFFPNGTYKTTAPLVPLPGRYKLCGTGRFKQYSQVFDPEPDCLPTIMPVHTGRAAILVDAGSSEVSFVIEDMNIATVETGSMPTAAIAWKSGAEFQTDYTFNRVAITGFTSAFDVFNSGGLGVGLVTINDCSITRNTHIWRNLDGQIVNVLRFTGNQAGQNTNGMTLEGSDIIIDGNNFESNANVITMTGTYTGFRVANNYFEANTGAYLIRLVFCNGAVIENNFNFNSTASDDIVLNKCVNIRTNEEGMKVTSDASFNVTANANTFWPSVNNRMGVATYYNKSLEQSLTRPDVVISAVSPSPTSSFIGIEGSVGELYTAAGSGNLNFTASGLSISADRWIMVSLLVSYFDEPLSRPIVTIKGDGGGDAAKGFYSAEFGEWNEAPPQFERQTVLYSLLTYTSQALTSIEVEWYPLGVNPTAGTKCVTSVPFIYNLSGTLPGLDGGNVQPFVPAEQIYFATAAPSTGTWPLGAKFYNRDPLAAEYIGFTCVSAGTPGTWKGFGIVET